MLVGPQADVAVGDPAVGGDGGRLDEDQAEAAQGEPSEVDEVMVAASPSATEYWHIGETTSRLGSVRSRRVSGERQGRASVVTGGLNAAVRPGSSDPKKQTS